MRQIFEGLSSACNYAELESRKKQIEMFVLKCGASGHYGINYQVALNRKEIKPGEKVVGHYKNGLKVI